MASKYEVVVEVTTVHSFSMIYADDAGSACDQACNMIDLTDVVSMNPEAILIEEEEE